MRKAVLILAGVILALCALVSLQQKRISAIKLERDIQLHNKDVLLGDANYRYRVLDSLNAISARELILTRRDFEAYRSETAAVIEALEIDMKKLESITAIQSQTIYELRNLPVKTVTDTLYMPGMEIELIEYSDKWIDLDVRLYADRTADIDVTSRESLICTEWIKRKKFLWFRYGAKERRQEIVSLNPHTEIVKSEFITIRE